MSGSVKKLDDIITDIDNSWLELKKVINKTT